MKNGTGAELGHAGLTCSTSSSCSFNRCASVHPGRTPFRCASVVDGMVLHQMTGCRSVSSLCSGLGRFGGERRSGLVGSTVLLSSRISSLKTRAVVSLVSHGVKVDLAQFLHREVLKGMSNCLSDRNSGLTFCTEANWLGPDAWIHRLLL